MNTQEFLALTGDFMEELTDRIEAVGGSVRMVPLGNTSHVFYVDDGNLYTPTECFELLNTGHEAKWEFRGFKGD